MPVGGDDFHTALKYFLMVYRADRKGSDFAEMTTGLADCMAFCGAAAARQHDWTEDQFLHWLDLGLADTRKRGLDYLQTYGSMTDEDMKTFLKQSGLY